MSPAKRAGKTESDQSLDLVWSRLQPLFLAKRNAVFEAFAAHDLTPPHGFALSLLSAGPIRMREMADRMVCDASYVTAIVDRLEALGLAVRRASATDRRVKEIALTALGAKTAADLEAVMVTPPAALAALSSADRATLSAILAKVVSDSEESIWQHHTARR